MVKIIKCKDCNEEKKHEARGLCYTCYNKIKMDLPSRPKVKCAECGEIKPHKARGLCLKCYSRALQRKHYAEGKTNRQSVKCNSCGEIKPHKAHGCCDNCYSAIRQRRTYHEDEEIRRKKLIKCKDYRRIKDVVKNEKCEQCGLTGENHIHHITYEENSKIQILCKECHMKVHRKHTFQWW